MSTSIEADQLYSDHGVSRRASVAPTMKSGKSIGAEHKEDNFGSDNNSSEEKPKKKNNIYLTFGGLQIALFLAALDR